MDDHAVLHRLYGDQLQGTSFPKAAEVIWIVRTVSMSQDAMRLEVISSGYWLDSLSGADTYDPAAYADEIR